MSAITTSNSNLAIVVVVVVVVVLAAGTDVVAETAFADGEEAVDGAFSMRVLLEDRFPHVGFVPDARGVDQPRVVRPTVPDRQVVRVDPPQQLGLVVRADHFYFFLRPRVKQVLDEAPDYPERSRRVDDERLVHELLANERSA